MQLTTPSRDLDRYRRRNGPETTVTHRPWPGLTSSTWVPEGSQEGRNPTTRTTQLRGGGTAFRRDGHGRSRDGLGRRRPAGGRSPALRVVSPGRTPVLFLRARGGRLTH